MESVDWKIVAAAIATVLGLLAFVPYAWELFRRRTQPHPYTWLIWSITLGLAAAGVWSGGGGSLAIGMVINVLVVATIFGLSLMYGTKNITRFDTVLLIIALGAILIWVGLDDPFLSVLFVTGIDLLGYIPTYRKSFNEPWSEALLAWIGFTLAYALGLLALAQYNTLTVFYPIVTFTANALFILLILVRRTVVPKPPIEEEPEH